MKYIKNVIICIIASVVLILAGANAISQQQSIEEKESTYKLTTFDYLVASPSREQISEWKESPYIDGIFPSFRFTQELKGNNTKNIHLYLSDDLDDCEIGFFNEKTLLRGNFDFEGIMLDEKASEALNVNIGDTVSFVLNNCSFSLKVSAIYMTTHYSGLEHGVAFAKFSEQMENLFDFKLQYNYAFLDVNNEIEVAKMLSDYKPLGLLKSFDLYLKEYMEESSCPSYMTEEEWIAGIKATYQEKIEKPFMDGNYTGAVQSKKEYMEDVKEQNVTTVEKINHGSIAVAVGIIVAYTALTIIFMYSNFTNDLHDAKDGKKNMRLGYYLSSIFGAIAVCSIVYVGLTIVGQSSYFKESFRIIKIAYGFPVLLSALINIPFINMYIKKIEDKKMVKSNSKSL